MSGDGGIVGQTGVMLPDERLDRETPPQSAPGPRPDQRRVGRYVLVLVMCTLLLVPFVPLIFWSVRHRWVFPTIIPDQFSDRAWSYLASERSHLLERLPTSLTIAMCVSVLAA